MIFVVDCNDRDRVGEAHDELHRMLSEDELQTASLLVYANKQDLPNAMSVAEVTDTLGLHTLRDREWYIQACCATSGEGLREGLEWVTTVGGANDGRASTAAVTKAPAAPADIEDPLALQKPDAVALPVVQAFPVLDQPAAPAAAVVAEPALAGGHVLLGQELAARSFAAAELSPEAAAAVQTALRTVSRHLRAARAATTERDTVVCWADAGGALQRSEAHWGRDRSQLRLVPLASLSVEEQRAHQQEQEEQEGQQVVALALQQAWDVLAVVAAGVVGGGRSATQLRAASALDAFCYVPSGGEGDGDGGEFSCAAHTDSCALTVLVADEPGFECRDERTGEWKAVPLGMGQVAVLAGRDARSLGLGGGEACEHRVRGGAAARTSVAIDFYAAPRGSAAA